MARLKPIILSTALFAAPFSAYSATLLQVNLGFKGSKIESEGQFGESKGAQIANPSEDTSYSELYLNFEHPFFLVPNVKLVSASAEFDGNATLTQTYSLNGQLYPVASTLATSVDYSHQDVIAYYEILDTSLIELDLGVNFRYQDVGYAVSESVNQTASKRSIEQWQPMGFGRLTMAVPLMGLGAYTEVNYLDSDNYELEVAASYEFVSSPLLDMSLSLGYKDVANNWEDVDGLVATHNWDGVFVGLDLKF